MGSLVMSNITIGKGVTNHTGESKPSNMLPALISKKVGKLAKNNQFWFAVSEFKDNYIKSDNQIGMLSAIIIDGDSSRLSFNDTACSAKSVHKWLKDKGYMHIIYTSYSQSATHNKWRAVIPCDMTIDQLEPTTKHLASHMQKTLDFNYAIENHSKGRLWFYGGAKHPNLYEYYSANGVRYTAVNEFNGNVFSLVEKQKNTTQLAINCKDLLNQGVSGPRNDWFRNYTMQMAKEGVIWLDHIHTITILLISQKESINNDGSVNPKVTLAEAQDMYDRAKKKVGNLNDPFESLKYKVSTRVHADSDCLISIEDINWDSVESTFLNTVMENTREASTLTDRGNISRCSIHKFCLSQYSTYFGSYLRTFDKVGMKIVAEEMEHNLIGYRQCKKIVRKTDFFATGSRLIYGESYTDLIEPHKRLRSGPFDQTIIDDYSAHFPSFLTLLDAIAASLFTKHHKLALLWVQAISDWGKSGLIKMLEPLGIVYMFDPDRIALALSGSPSGIDAEEMQNAYVWIMDEAQRFPLLLLQMDSKFTITPKQKMEFPMIPRMKLVMGAQTIKTFGEDGGVDKQIANRLSKARVTPVEFLSRPLVQKVGPEIYSSSITNFIGNYLNSLIKDYVAMGKALSAKKSMNVLTTMHEALSIESLAGLAQDDIDVYADELDSIIRRIAGYKVSSKAYQEMGDDHIFKSKIGNVEHICISKPTHFFDKWVHIAYKGNIEAVSNIKTEILLSLSMHHKNEINKGSVRWRFKTDTGRAMGLALPLMKVVLPVNEEKDLLG